MTEAGRLMKGETVRGTWARRRWGPISVGDEYGTSNDKEAGINEGSPTV